MATFGITSPKGMLDKLTDEFRDFEDGHCLSARHAMNAVITAYHLHEWVWGAFVKQRGDLQDDWQLSPGKKSRCEDFRNWLEREQQCPAMADARMVANGTKHFGISKIPTGAHRGLFQRNMVQAHGFDVSYLWIERNGRKQRAEEFIKELHDFWVWFFARYAVQ
jgi:hypothetical protein